jgi:hypothetical protein
MISPAGPSAKGKLDRFVQVTANANVGVVAGKSDVLVACAPRMSLTMPGPDIENGHWAAMHLVSLFMGDDGDNLLHPTLGLVHLRIVFALAPHDHRQLAAWRERTPDVSQRKSRQIEKHRAESREHVIVRTPKIVALRIGAQKRNVV